MTRRRLQVRAESQQTPIAILYHELAAVPGHVAKSTSEFNALGGVLGIECVGIFHEEVRVEQFVRVFVRIGGGRGGAAEMNHLLVARHDGVDRRILPRAQTCEAKLAGVIGERCGNVHGEEDRRNLTEHGPSLPQMARASPLTSLARLPHASRSLPACGFSLENSWLHVVAGL